MKLVNWLVKLPKGHQREFIRKVDELEKEDKMPYVTEWEERGIEKGIEKGSINATKQNLEIVLSERFGQVPEDVLNAVRKLEDQSRLQTLLRAAVKVSSLQEFQAALAN